MQVSHLNEFQVIAVEAALDKMFKGRMFDICTVREVAEVLGRPVGGDDFKALRLFHCIEYGSMTPKVRQQVRDMTLKVLGFELPSVQVVEEVVEPKATSIARWLLGVKK